MCTSDIYTFIQDDGIQSETCEIRRCPAYHKGIPCDPIINKHPVTYKRGLSTASILHTTPSPMSPTLCLEPESTGSSQKENDLHVSDPTVPSMRPRSSIDSTNDEATSDDSYQDGPQLTIESDSESDVQRQGNLQTTSPSVSVEQNGGRVFVFEEVSESDDSDPLDGETERILQSVGYESADSEGPSSSDEDVFDDEFREFIERQRERKRRIRMRNDWPVMRTRSETDSSDNENLPSSTTEVRNGPTRRKRMRMDAAEKKDSDEESLFALEPITILDLEDEQNKVHEGLRVYGPDRLAAQVEQMDNFAHAEGAVIHDDTEQAPQSELVLEEIPLSNAALPVNLETSSTGDLDVEGLLHVANSDEDELASVMSTIPSLTTGSTLSSTFAVPSNLIESTPGWVLALLVRDEIMRDLLASTCGKMGPEKFQRNFLRLFRSMLSGMKADSKVADGDLRTGLRFLRHQSRNISSHICKEIFGLKDVEDWSALSRMRPDKSWQMKKYLADYGQVGHPGDHAPLNEGELSSDSDLAGVDSVGTIGTLTRQKLETILLQSRSFLEFRERYQKFLFPDLVQESTEKDRTENLEAEESPNCPNDLNVEQQLEPNLGMRRWISVVYTSLVRLSRRIMRPQVKQGYRRLEWACDCREELYADFPESDPESLDQLRLLLNCKSIQSKHSVASIAETGTGTTPSTLQSLSHLPQQPGSTYHPSSGRETSNQQNGRSLNHHFNQRLRDETSDRIPHSHPSQLQKRFLELCVNTGEFQRHLGEINITDVENDSQLFDRVREKYIELRSFRAKYFLLKPVDVHFVQFSLEDRYRVGILDKPMAIPTEEEMLSEGYGYHPCPMKPPPIPAHIFLHYLSHQKGAHKRLIWGRRIPQKLHKSILETHRTDGLITGWGIHIIEGLDRFTALVATLVILFVSGVIGISWALARADVQGGVGIGAWLTSVQAVVLMMVLTKWNEI